MSSLATSTGVRLSVQNQSDSVPFDQGISLPVGAQTDVAVFRKFSSHMEKPFSECEQNIDETYPSDMVKLTLKSGYAYTQVNCFFTCYQFYLIERCNCYDSSPSAFPFEVLLERNVYPCLNLSQLACDTQVDY